jgi:propanol-preferring alcohol dehydrogenase
MKAAVFYGKGQPLKVQEVPIPEISPDEILVKVSGCGICQSDLEYIDLGVPRKPLLLFLDMNQPEQYQRSATR